MVGHCAHDSLLARGRSSVRTVYFPVWAANTSKKKGTMYGGQTLLFCSSWGAHKGTGCVIAPLVYMVKEALIRYLKQTRESGKAEIGFPKGRFPTF